MIESFADVEVDGLMMSLQLALMLRVSFVLVEVDHLKVSFVVEKVVCYEFYNDALNHVCSWMNKNIVYM